MKTLIKFLTEAKHNNLTVSVRKEKSNSDSKLYDIYLDLCSIIDIKAKKEGKHPVAEYQINTKYTLDDIYAEFDKKYDIENGWIKNVNMDIYDKIIGKFY